MSEEDRDFRKELLHLYTTNYQTFYGLVLAVAVVLFAEAELLASAFLLHFWYLVVIVMTTTIGGGAGVLLNGFYWARMTHAVIMNVRSSPQGNDSLSSLHRQYRDLVNDRGDCLAKFYAMLNFDDGSGRAIAMFGLIGMALGILVSVIILTLSGF